MNKIEGALILSILGIISYISMIITFNTRAVIYLKFIDKILQKTIK